ncbi:hypothetical protein [Streptomyces sp. NPDC050504]|uniref:hypothetical protein n=1 Tax=Streptomyces sp. NPDC050504 TaxID=3365618 RepID=UPI00378A4414
MGVVITAAAVSAHSAGSAGGADSAANGERPGDRSGARYGDADNGSIAHCVRAARDCLAQTDVAPGRIGMLIHTGVYRDGNLMEPAMAALVQHRLGINPDYARDTARPVPTVSFDMANGACGVLDAVAVAQAFLAADPIAYALIVTADAHPGSGPPPPGFPYDNCGGALLLTGSDLPGTGFGPVRTALTADGGWAVEGYCDLSAPDAPGAVDVRSAPDAVERIAACAAELALRTVDEAGVGIETVRVIASDSPPGLGARTVRRLGLPPHALVTQDAPRLRAHTAAPVIGYVHARRTAPARPARSSRAVRAGVPSTDPPGAQAPTGPLLFLTAGAGPSAACALYFPEPSA